MEITEVYNPYGEQLVFRYKKADGYETPDEKSNVVIGALTTCYGRLRLYELLDKLQERVLYFDTDSVSLEYFFPNLLLPEVFEQNQQILL